MTIYRVRCTTCDMKDRLRMDEEAATFEATKHAERTGHRTEIQDVMASTEVVVNSGVYEPGDRDTSRRATD